MSKVIDGGGGVAMLRQMALTCVHPALAVVEEEEDVRERWLKSIQVSGTAPTNTCVFICIHIPVLCV